MHLLMRRYTRSGYASRWFLWVLAAAFVALAVWGVVRSDWLVLTLAILMAAVTLAAVPISRRLADGLRESRRALDAEKEARDG
ncbi:MAG: hypothetical protein WEB52_11045 [Dehalococcoidia bacterium]